MVEVNCRDGARAHVVSKQVLIVLATNFFNVTCQDVSRIHSSVDRNFPEGLRANDLRPLSSVLAGSHRLHNKGLGGGTMVLARMH